MTLVSRNRLRVSRDIYHVIASDTGHPTTARSHNSNSSLSHTSPSFANMGNTNNVPPEARKTVVVLGLGPTGVAFLRGLIDAKATGLFNILIVEPKDSFYHAIGSLRAVVDTDVAAKVVIPYDALVRRAGPTARHIRGKATSVTETEVVVTLNDGTTQTLDFGTCETMWRHVCTHEHTLTDRLSGHWYRHQCAIPRPVDARVDFS